MKLHELLSVLSFDIPIAIHNVDDKRDKRPQFQKLRNVNMYKVRNILNYDIMQISMSQKGLWVQVFNRDSLHRNLQAWNIADKWFMRQDQRNGRR